MPDFMLLYTLYVECGSAHVGVYECDNDTMKLVAVCKDFAQVIGFFATHTSGEYVMLPR